MHSTPRAIRLSILALLAVTRVSAETCDAAKTTKTTYGKYTVVAIRGGVKNFHFVAGMAIDADGAPDAYGPDGKGRDRLANAGKPGHWQALVTDDGKPSGKPIVQGDADPAPGFYVSTTTLEDRSKAAKDPHRYVDASKIPYVVLPGDLAKKQGAKPGDFALVRRPISDDDEASKPSEVGAIFADVGPKGQLGEGSIALAEALGIPSDPKTGGTAASVTYIVFPGSGNGKPRSADEIAAETKKLAAKYAEISSACASE